MGALRRGLLAAALPLAMLLAGCQPQQDQDSTTVNTGSGVPQAPVGPVPGPKPPLDTRPGPYTGDAVALVQGRELFVRYNCSGCHGGRGGGGMGPSLRDEDWIYGSSDADIFDSISQGRAHGMPAWGTRVPEQQLWKLVAYIDSMRKPNEPDAPRE
jgi:cytochrome c oxidase cbb3-type subunit 3